MSYYGARYYDAKTSLWLNTDPKMEKYPNIGAYVFVANNPINLIDPDGKDIIGAFNKTTGRLTLIDRDQYKSGLPILYVNAKNYKLNGVRDKKGNLTHNQVLVVENVFTGGHSDDGKIVRNDPDRPNEKPISKGEYNILENKGNTNPDHDSFFVLDPKDSSPYDKKDDRPGELNAQGKKRNGYNLHPGRVSWGCVTINKDDVQMTTEQRAEEWSVINTMINKTSSEDVPDNRGKQKYVPFTTQKKFGTIKVTE
ncbi:hypothetical protein D3C85_886990 [compost metagenome]